MLLREDLAQGPVSLLRFQPEVWTLPVVQHHNLVPFSRFPQDDWLVFLTTATALREPVYSLCAAGVAEDGDSPCLAT